MNPAAGPSTGAATRPGRVPRENWVYLPPSEQIRVEPLQNNQPYRARPLRHNVMQSQRRGWFPSVLGRLFSSKPALARVHQTHGTTQTVPVANRGRTAHNCCVCYDPIHGPEIRTPCGHSYDIGCITNLFESAVKDEALYPPRCCNQIIPVAHVQPHLSPTLMRTFQEKKVEFGTRKRVYCSSPACSRFLGPLSENSSGVTVYTCSVRGCGRRTCAKCRERYHGGWTHVCRPSAETAKILRLGRTAGWARCPGCSQLIELNQGCFHMTCRCGTEFCYLCQAPWKTCRCPRDEARWLVDVDEE